MSDYLIGLTGGVASGKSLAESAFRELGIGVADADAAARAALAPGSQGLREVVAAFGPNVLGADGSLDRAAMRRRIFEDAEARHVLEGIVHPRVRAALHAACQTAASPYAIASIPLLAEVGGRRAYPWLRRILVIDADEAARLARLQARDGIEAGLARRMLAAQTSRTQRLAIADDVIRNDGTPEALAAQVAALDRLYRRLAAT
ncbi:MAG: dephospho-CoA kinase [Pseudomonadota bacterium]